VTKKKKLVPVLIQAATTWCVEGGVVGFLGTNLNMYWVDSKERKEFAGLHFKEGAPVWLYVTAEKARVLTVLPNQGEREEDLLAADPVEMEV
jgi:hypothetical protein